MRASCIGETNPVISSVLLFLDVTDALEEEQTEDVMLAVRGIYLAPEDVRCAPEVGFELLEC